MDDKDFKLILDQIKKGSLPAKVGHVIHMHQFEDICRELTPWIRKHGTKNFIEYLKLWELGIIDKEV
jgi:hypothetical protein